MKKNCVFDNELFDDGLVTASFKITRDGLTALQFIREHRGGSSNKDVFNLVYIFVASLGCNDCLIKFLPHRRYEERIQRRFMLNGHTLTGLQKLSREYALSVDDLVDQAARVIKELLDRSIEKDQRSGSKQEALSTINERGRAIFGFGNEIEKHTSLIGC